MTSRHRSFLLLGLAAIGLSACGNSGKTASPTTPVQPPVVARAEDQFGSCFATRFRADANSKATDPVPCPDLAPLSLTTKPVVL